MLDFFLNIFYFFSPPNSKKKLTEKEMLSFLFFLLSNRGIQFSGGEIGEVHESLFICATKVLRSKKKK
jgi:hypothetical protein